MAKRIIAGNRVEEANIKGLVCKIEDMMELLKELKKFAENIDYEGAKGVYRDCMGNNQVSECAHEISESLRVWLEHENELPEGE